MTRPVTSAGEASGSPLGGLRFVEVGGIGAVPFAGMMLADHGAEVIRIERAPASVRDPVLRSRRSIILDLKQPAATGIVRALARTADGLMEGFRPGTMERLGLGPDTLLADNPRLVYGRMTGWGQDGPLAKAAGHDLLYLATSGALQGIGRPDAPPPVPLNLIGDYGGGAMMLAFGMLSAVIAAQRTGRGQVVDAAINEGAALLTSMFYGVGPRVNWQEGRGAHLLTGAAPFYDTYETADGLYVAVAAIEPAFYALLLEKLDLRDDPAFTPQMDRARWPAAKARLVELFRRHSRAHWCKLLEGTDACVAPVLSPDEAVAYPHNVARGAFRRAFGLVQPSPTPRYATAGHSPPTFRAAGEDADTILLDAGFTASDVAGFRLAGVLGAPAASSIGDVTTRAKVERS